VRSLGIDVGGSSVKVALIDGQKESHAKSGGYRTPDRSELIDCVREAIFGLNVDLDFSVPVGLCLPGRRASTGDRIETSLNLPCLNDWVFADLLESVLGWCPARYRVVSDIAAAAHDIVRSADLRGRVLVLAIGTGVGMALLEDGELCSIGSRGIGHIGQIDVGRIGDSDRLNADGSRNTLESFVGLASLLDRFPGHSDAQIAGKLGQLTMGDPFMMALVHALRIAHAIYVPRTIVIAGGVGLALRGRSGEIKAAVSDALTTLADPDWSLVFGDSLYHAASGAARLADV
jgi:predicted NBD/HSP70 family sugar kinase